MQIFSHFSEKSVIVRVMGEGMSFLFHKGTHENDSVRKTKNNELVALINDFLLSCSIV